MPTICSAAQLAAAFHFVRLSTEWPRPLELLKISIELAKYAKQQLGCACAEQRLVVGGSRVNIECTMWFLFKKRIYLKKLKEKNESKMNMICIQFLKNKPKFLFFPKPITSLIFIEFTWSYGINEVKQILYVSFKFLLNNFSLSLVPKDSWNVGPYKAIAMICCTWPANFTIVSYCLFTSSWSIFHSELLPLSTPLSTGYQRHAQYSLLKCVFTQGVS